MLVLTHLTPALFCLSEPTSGLDSSTAYTIVALLKRLAQRGRTVICTIHTPSSRIFALFDRLMLLTPMGEMAYLGPADEALHHFHRLGHVCPPTMSAGDFLRQLANEPRLVALSARTVRYSCMMTVAIVCAVYSPRVAHRRRARC